MASVSPRARELRQSGEAGVGRSGYESRAADSLGLPEVFVNATEVFGIKQTKITGTPLGTIDINQNLNGPRASVNATWSIYSGGRITATGFWEAFNVMNTDNFTSYQGSL